MQLRECARGLSARETTAGKFAARQRVCYLFGSAKIKSTGGGVPKWLRERSAKPPFNGSNPFAASKLSLYLLNADAAFSTAWRRRLNSSDSPSFRAPVAFLL
jgi:hypothetical protein